MESIDPRILTILWVAYCDDRAGYVARRMPDCRDDFILWLQNWLPPENAEELLSAVKEAYDVE